MTGDMFQKGTDRKCECWSVCGYRIVQELVDLVISLGQWPSSHTDTLEISPELWTRHLKAEVKMSLQNDSSFLVSCNVLCFLKGPLTLHMGRRADPVISNNQTCPYCTNYIAIKLINFNNVVIQFHTYINFITCKF